MTTFVFVRHGKTTWNAKKRQQGQTDVPLTDEGRVSMQEHAERFAAEGLSVDSIISSDLIRASATAHIFAEH